MKRISKISILSVPLIVIVILLFTFKTSDDLSISVAWHAPTEYTDGSKLEFHEIEYYELTWLEMNTKVSESAHLPPNYSRYEITGLDAGSYEVSISAMSVYGTQSDSVNEIKVLKRPKQ